MPAVSSSLSARPLAAVSSPPDRPRAARIGRLVAFDHCKIPLRSFTFLRHADAVARLHQRVLELETDVPAQPTAAQRFLASLLWLLRGARAAFTYHRRYAGYVRRLHGISRVRQARDLLYGVWRHNTFPRHYYWRKLFLLPSRAEWLANLEHRQVNDLITDLNRHLPVERLLDKHAFYQHCQATGLPTPPVLAIWRDGVRCDDTVTPDRLPPQDLFAKPVADYGSVGTLSLIYDPRAGGYRHEEELVSAAGVLEHLRQRSIGTGYLLQPKLRNGGGWADYADRDLCNLRIVTGRFPDGEPLLIASFLRMPSSHTTIGHDRHVLLSAVDVETGRMGPGLFREITKGRFDRHPDTNAPITDRLLPGWGEKVALTLAAHRTLPWMPFIGWDVVESDDGLFLLEANAFWGADAAQLPGAVPLGRTAFPAIYWAWTEKFARA